MPVTQESAYQQQLEHKLQVTREEFACFGVDKITVYASPEKHYRMRAEFKAWHQNNKVAYAMYHAGQNRQPYTLDYYEPGSAKIQQLMPLLIQYINSQQELKERLFQIEFLTTTTDDALVTLIYHRPLGETWLTAAIQAAADLGIHIVGRSRKQKLVVGQEFVVEKFNVGNKDYFYQQLESSFTQPNASVCQHMLNWAVQNSRAFGGDLLELYCGNGNFTLPLAANFRRILATEVSKPGIQSALYNCELNQVDNITFVRMSSEELSEALNQTRSFARLKEVNLTEYQFSTIFVDPPRSGLDAGTNELIKRFDNIIYISCNPQTLKQNLLNLGDSHTVISMALFDQFPYTEHRECGVVLRRKT